jgi:hypothetical protein
MLDNIKIIDSAPVHFADPDDITLGELLGFLDGHADRPLVFF